MSYWLMTRSMESLGRAAPAAKRTLQRKCDECLKKKPELQRSAIGSAPRSVPPIVHEVLRSPGSPLDRMSRDFFEPRFAHDFSRVRVHTDSRAAESAQEVNARAYAVGHDVVFGSGQYMPKNITGRLLLAHELSHVVHQERNISGLHKFDIGTLDSLENEAHNQAIKTTIGRRIQLRGQRGTPALQRSSLSNDVEKSYSFVGKKGVFDLLRANSPLTVKDPDLEKWLITNLNGDDLWLAQKIMEKGPEPLWDDVDFSERFKRSSTNKWASEPGRIEGTIGMSSGLISAKIPIKAFYFPGETDQRALILGGVHGSELSGIEAAKRLVQSLRDRFDKTGKIPHWTTIIIPELIPETAAQARARPSTMKNDSNVGREISVPKQSGKGTKEIFPARQFPAPGRSLSDLTTAGGPVDAKGKRLKDVENVPVPLLPETVALLKLIERFKPTRIASIHAHRFGGKAERGKDAPGIFVDPRGGLDKKRIPKTGEGKADDALALALAKEAEHGGARVPGNWLKSSKPEVHYADSAGHPPGFSLGDWGPTEVPGARMGMTVITVEIEHYYESGQDPSSARAKELQAHSDALQKVFLESP
jgi:hypothetical protein